MKTNHKSKKRPNKASLRKENFYMATSTPPTIDPKALKAAQAALENSSSNADAPGVDKIRELLFGNQMQDYDRRFSLMEDRFQQKLRDMESESARGMASL